MGIFKLNGIDYMGGGGGGNTNYEELTQLEYDALTEEEKNNGTIYFITDTNSNQDGKFQPIIYSESEREVGVWTDGKPLYQKTVILESTDIHDGSYQKYIDVPCDNPDNIVDTKISLLSTGSIISVPLPYVNTTTIYIGYFVDTLTTTYARFQLRYGSGITSNYFNGALVVLQYTKTTDSPGSGQWTPQGIPAHHYSENEQIVGTWVDGKTVYEQTIIGNAISDTGINVLWERTDIDTVVEYNCIFLDGDNLEYNANYYYSTGAYFRVFVDTQNVWTNTKGIVCQRSSNQGINGTRLTVRYTKTTS